MLPPLCRSMAVNRPVSRVPAGAGGDSYLAMAALAGSIVAGTVGRLYSEWPLRRRVPAVAGGLPPGSGWVARQQGSTRKEPPVAGACTVGGVFG
jgi:hypothetical protein